MEAKALPTQKKNQRESDGGGIFGDKSLWLPETHPTKYYRTMNLFWLWIGSAERDASCKATRTPTMTKERMRVVIAEWMGFEKCQHPLANNCTCNGEITPLMIHPTSRAQEFVPNYPEDLNTIHEAERRMNINQLAQYADELDKICVPVHICPLTHWEAVIMSTALQRCEALIRTIGRWEDDSK